MDSPTVLVVVGGRRDAPMARSVETQIGTDNNNNSSRNYYRKGPKSVEDTTERAPTPTRKDKGEENEWMNEWKTMYCTTELFDNQTIYINSS